jgi:DHA2 family multidrug resistance protein-like MFS transporter
MGLCCAASGNTNETSAPTGVDMSTAASMMTRNVVTIPEKSTIKEYLQRVQEQNFSGCPVIDNEGFAVGFISQGDVLRGLTSMLSSGDLALEGKQRRQLSIALLLSGKTASDASLFDRFLSMSVSEVMAKGIYSCHAHTPIPEVCETMSRLRIHRLVVVDEYGKVSGIISSLDALRVCSREIKFQERERPLLKNFPPVNEEPADKEVSD